MSSPAVYVGSHALAGLLGGLTGLAGIFLFFGTWPSIHRAVLLGVVGSSTWGVLVGLFLSVPALRASWPAVPRLHPQNVAVAFALPAFFPCLFWLLLRSLRQFLSA